MSAVASVLPVAAQLCRHPRHPAPRTRAFPAAPSRRVVPSRDKYLTPKRRPTATSQPGDGADRPARSSTRHSPSSPLGAPLTPSPTTDATLATRVLTVARRALTSLAMLVAFTLGSFVSPGMARDGTPHHGSRHPVYYPTGIPTASATTAAIIGRTQMVDYTAGLANMNVPTGDVGSMGGLTPDNWGLPYKGSNPAMALFMASAGVTLRMVVNVAVIYCIYTYWFNDGEDD